MKLRLCIWLYLLFFSVDTSAQKLKDLLKDGDESFKIGNYFEAVQYFYNALQSDSSNLETQYKYAESSRFTFDYSNAERWYAKVYKKDNGTKYKDCLFWLAMMKKQNGRYKEAKKLFEKYYKKYKKKDTYLSKKSKQEMEACDFAMLAMSDTAKIKIIHLDTLINSRIAEYAPHEITGQLFYSSLKIKNQKSKIYSATVKGDEYKESKPLNIKINHPETHNVNATFSKDGKMMYFSRCEEKSSNNFNCKIYKSQKENDDWAEPSPLPAIINDPSANTTQPHVAEIGKDEYLFFVSDRNGTLGGLDIWYSKINKDGSFSEAVNAGPLVNSPEDEKTPFFCTPCGTLFFSSTWHKSLGGYDIFKSDFVNGSFTEPQNMGYPINSRFNDLYFSVNDKEDKVYLSSNRPGSFFEKNESCCNDIYYFKPEHPTKPAEPEPPLKDSTVLFARQAKLLVPLTLYFHNDEPDNKTQNTSTKKNYAGTYWDYIKLLDKYKEEYSRGLKGEEKERAHQNISDFFEDSVSAGFHDLEKFSLLLEKILAEGKTVDITMKGFCSPLASTNYNVNLAKRRISSLVNYFTEYKNGLFIPYIKGEAGNKGKINFIEEDIGELQAKPNTSDNPNDVKNSVYSINAASERKIQIIAFEMK